MNLIEYIKANDDDVKWRIEYCKNEGIDFNEYILDGYCPSVFKCFDNTEFSKPYSPLKKDKADCKYRHNINNKKCCECWNRQIEDEYSQYLKLKQKFEK